MSLNSYSFANICKALQEGITVKDLVNLTGMHTMTARRLLKNLYDQRLTFIDDWANDAKGYPTMRVFRFIRSPADIDMPKPVSRETLMRYPKGHPRYVPR